MSQPQKSPLEDDELFRENDHEKSSALEMMGQSKSGKRTLFILSFILLCRPVFSTFIWNTFFYKELHHSDTPCIYIYIY